MPKMRVQKAIADSGMCSRRKAEQMVLDKRVKINGHLATIGDQVDPNRDVIHVDGQRISDVHSHTLRYLMLYKPRGYVTTLSDEKDRRCVADLLAEVEERVYPIGRLDVNSEGLLLLTNDGAFANQITHPRHHVSKTYRVTVRPDITDLQAAKLSEGVMVDGRRTSPAQVRVLTKEPNRVVLEMIIREGRNRQIRKMMEEVGLEVARLKRTAVGPVKLGMLKPGAYRDLTAEELKALRTAVKGKAE